MRQDFSKDSILAPEVISAIHWRKLGEMERLQSQTSQSLLWWQKEARMKARELAFPGKCPLKGTATKSDKMDSRTFLFLDAIGQNSRFPSLLHSFAGSLFVASFMVLFLSPQKEIC